MLNIIKDWFKSIQAIYLVYQYFHTGLPSITLNLRDYHRKFIVQEPNTTALDLGAGFKPQNHFLADSCIGIDLNESHENGIICVDIGNEPLPFEDNSITYITAYDLLEHIPRISIDRKNPFIFCMNEIYRVLKPGGIFLSSTPIFPYLGAFQDPTHTNIMTRDTFRMYFSCDKEDIANAYGINTNFIILEEGMLQQSYISVMSKCIK